VAYYGQYRELNFKLSTSFPTTAPPSRFREADRGVLFTVEHSRHDKIEIPIKSGDGKK
jgi:hypothetical protein